MKKNSFAAVTLKIALITFCVFTFCGCASKSDTSKQLSYKKNSSSQKNPRPVMAFSPSGKFLAVAKDKIIKLVDPSTGNILKTLTPEGTVFSLSFDPYEKHIALGMYRQVQIWDFENKKLVKTIPAQSDIVTHVTFDPTGGILATGSRGADLNINFWNTTNWQHKNTLTMKDHYGYANNIQAMAFSQDGNFFSATGLDKKIHIWSAQAGKKIADISNNSKVIALSLSPDGTLVAAGDEEGKLKIWKVKTQERVSESVADSSLVHALSFNRKGDLLATAGESNIKLWNTSTWEYEKDIGFKSGASVLFNSGNLTAIVLAPGGAVSLYELTSQNYALPVIQSTKALAPMISVVSPDLNTETDLDTIKVSGKVQGAVQIDKITILVNGSPLAERTRDRSLSSNDLKVVPFEEKVNLTKEGVNEIKISAIDINGLETTEVITVNKLSLEGKVWGVAIGIGNYENKEINSLKYAASDARSFYNYLKDDYGIPEKNLFLLTDSEATNKNIRDLLGVKIKKQARKNDTVIIYYAGHGALEVDSTVDDGDGMEKYLIPYDADPASLFSTAIPMEEVSKILGRIKAERVAFIADTCFSGASDIKPGRTLLAANSNRTRAISKNFLKRLTQRQSKGRVVLTASEANERSIENDELQAGVFTHFLIRALKGEADADNNGFITADEAYKFISERVPDATAQEQHPVKKGDESGQLILGRIKK